MNADHLYDQIRRFLQDHRQPYVTTLFDYYAFPTGESRGWEFAARLKVDASVRGADAVVDAIEREIGARAVAGLASANARARLIPYVQLHELEALFFAEPETMAAVFGDPALAATFAAAVEQCGGCEGIDDHPRTAPSKRIERAFPGYTKGRSDFAHGPRIAQRLDLANVRARCPRFDAWLAKLEAL